MTKFIKSLILSLFMLPLIWLNVSVWAVSSTDTNFVIIPESKQSSETNWVDSKNQWTNTYHEEAIPDWQYGPWKQVRDDFWQKYREKAEKTKNDIWAQMSSWIMDWDTIINYIAYLVRFLSQLALVIWAWMIIFAWYKYAMQVYWWKAQDWATAIKDAIIWIIVVTFAYAIIRIVSYAFL